MFVASRIYCSCWKQHFDVYLFLLCFACTEGERSISQRCTGTRASQHRMRFPPTAHCRYIDNMRTEKFIKNINGDSKRTQATKEKTEIESEWKMKYEINMKNEKRNWKLEARERISVCDSDGRNEKTLKWNWSVRQREKHVMTPTSRSIKCNLWLSGQLDHFYSLYFSIEGAATVWWIRWILGKESLYIIKQLVCWEN